MAIVFNGLFGSAQSATAGTSLNINPADITVAAGDDIFLAYAGDDVGSAFGVTDGGTASITWTQEKETIFAGNVKAQLWRGNVTSGGTLTDITISWTTNVTAKAAVAGWYSGVGTRDGTDGSTNTTGGVTVLSYNVVNWQNGDLVIGTGGHEGPNTDALDFLNSGGTFSSSGEVAQNGTSGGGAAGNISVNLIYGIASADGTAGSAVISSNGSVRDAASAGAVYSPAAAAAPGPVMPLRHRRLERFTTLR